MADQGRVLHRGYDFAVFDEVGFGALKDEIAGGDVDLSAAKVDGPNTALD